VTTNSLCQGEQAAILWPLLFDGGVNITFAVPDFRWSNNASHNAVVNVSIVGLSLKKNYTRYISDDGHKKSVPYINQYLISSSPIDIQPMSKNPLNRPPMVLGNMAKDGGNLILSQEDGRVAVEKDERVAPYLFDFIGSQEFVKGFKRKCIWIDDNAVSDARNIAFIDERLKRVTAMRKASDAESTRSSADQPHRFKQIQGSPLKPCMIVPRHTSENRDYLPVGLLPVGTVLADSALGIFDAPLWCLSLIASSLHRTWIATVCGKIKSDFRYSSTLGWNTFPIPTLTEKNKADLTRCAEDILLAREAHFPATIADLYEVKGGVPQMPTDLRAAHERNDEVLERIYIGRRFKNDTERLEKLFELYTKMTAAQGAAMKTTKARARA
jgi:hypothetical protein